ncbi:M14 family zinc carboxypeptidase, partial [uncultured Clostridium sp.]|uniref:M14 family zinc carboxypeptidase n=1 Tax=uncultured Clostridium sp. TaxID=59620 RepID=UPI002625BBA7
MKKGKLLALALISTFTLSVALISTHTTKVYADTLSEVPGYTQPKDAVLPKATELPTSLYRSNNISNNFYIYNIPGVQRVQYGTSGEGRPLYYYKIGNGKNTLVANFAIHGFEDSWAQDGYQLTKIAHQLIEKFNSKNNSQGLNNWSVIIIPCANPDGVLDGWTNNGPGRAQISKHIDLNRDFPTYFVPEYNARNYTGPHPLGAPEAQALANLVPKISRESRNMVLLDVHGWLDMTIGDPQIGRYFINNLGLSRNAGYIPAGHGYFVSYGHAQGAEVSLVELPDTTSASQVTSRNYVGKMYNAMNQVMSDGTGFSYINKTGIVTNTPRLNIRSGATTDGSILGSLNGGQAVHILGSINGWYKIYQPGIGYAYVSSDYIKVTGNGGSTTAPSTGWQKINGNWYYFNSNGKMEKNAWLKQSNGQTFYLGSDGIKVIGTHTIDNAVYIFNNAGVLERKWEIINGSNHVFDKDGTMLTGWIEQWDSWYYFNNNGAMRRNNWLKQSNGQTFYLGSNGIKYIGKHTIDGVKYTFNSAGILQANLKGWQTIHGKRYYFNSKGIKVIDWQEIDGNWYYFNNDGVMRKNEWLKQSNGQTFYLGSNGIKVIGTHTINNAVYIFNNAGVLERKWE